MSNYSALISKLTTSRAESFTNTKPVLIGQRFNTVVERNPKFEMPTQLEFEDPEPPSIHNAKVDPKHARRQTGLIQVRGMPVPESIKSAINEEISGYDERVDLKPEDADIRDQPTYAPGRYNHGGHPYRMKQFDYVRDNYYANLEQSEEFKDAQRRAFADLEPKYDLRTPANVPLTPAYERQQINTDTSHIRHITPKLFTREKDFKKYYADADEVPEPEKNRVKLDDPVETENLGIINKAVSTIVDAVTSLFKSEPMPKEEIKPDPIPYRETVEIGDNSDVTSRQMMKDPINVDIHAQPTDDLVVESMYLHPDNSRLDLMVMESRNGRLFNVQLDLSTEPEILAQLKQYVRMRDTGGALEFIMTHIEESYGQLPQMTKDIDVNRKIQIKPNHKLLDMREAADMNVKVDQRVKDRPDLSGDFNVGNNNGLVSENKVINKNIMSKNIYGSSIAPKQLSKHTWHTPASVLGI